MARPPCRRALTALVVAPMLACSRPAPDGRFKLARSVELFLCEPSGSHECPAPDTRRFSIDAARFRDAVSPATYRDDSLWSKGSFLVRVQLPDGSTSDLKVHYGAGVIRTYSGTGLRRG